MKLKINNRTVEVDVRDYDLDVVCRKHTCNATFADFVTKNAPTYRPSIYMGGKGLKAQRELLCLTLAYNRWMKAQGDTRRVYKADWHPVFYKEHPDLAEMVVQRCAVSDCKALALHEAPISIDGLPKTVQHVCKAHLDAAQEDCDHKFVDSKNCLKCGWTPPTCQKHHVPLAGAICLKCESEIDAAIMPTISDVR